MIAANAPQTIVRPVLLLALGLLVATPARAPAADAHAKQPMPRPRLVSKEVFLPRHDHQAHVTGFVAYVSNSKPLLMHCSGRIDNSDTYDDYAVRTSSDNGRTWSAGGTSRTACRGDWEPRGKSPPSRVLAD